MDKNAIKKFAVWARRELIERIAQKALAYGISENEIIPANLDSIGNRVLSATEKYQRQVLISEIEHKGYAEVIEEVAYTWFNRFTALRFMEVNGYLPSRVRVFTDAENNFKPQILDEALNLDLPGLDKDKVFAYKEANETGKLYKYLLITQCNALSSVLPGMFQKIADYTELLLPDNLLREGNVIEQMLTLIPENNWNVNSIDEDGKPQGQVEIIGWLYQFYNNEPKDELINGKHQYKRNDIPFVTQLFTSDWIVRYIVENTLGRIWLEGHEDIELKRKLSFYIENDKVLPEIKELGKKLTPEDLTCIDPCTGSGHILVYAFDVLMKIYVNYGYSVRDAVSNIIKNNIFGLDIDKRAGQIAYFAVMMKARQYDSRFFTRNIKPNIYYMMDSSLVTQLELEYFVGTNFEVEKEIQIVIKSMRNANEYGSLINIPKINFEILYNRINEIKAEDCIFKDEIIKKIHPLIKIAEVLSRRYYIVITNPPYMSIKYMTNNLKEFISDEYNDYKSDLFAAFIVKLSQMCLKNGHIGVLTPYVWMFLQTYEALRNYIYKNMTFSSLVQLEYNAFEAACVPVAAFSFRNQLIDVPFIGIKLSDFKGSDLQAPKCLYAIENKTCNYRYEISQKSFNKIKGAPVAYWVSSNAIDKFKKFKSLGELTEIRQGLATSNNDKYLRLWHEVKLIDIDFVSKNTGMAKARGYKWFPFNKGGDFRKWYGNQEYIVNYQNDGKKMKSDVLRKYTYLKTPDFVIKNTQFYFLPSITWTEISASYFGVRYSPSGFIFSNKSNSIFTKSKNELLYYLSFLCTKVANLYIKSINPTITTNVGDVKKIPVIYDESNVDKLINTTLENIKLSKVDWDSFETSWNFKISPLIENNSKLWDISSINCMISHYYGEIPKVKSNIELCYLLWKGQCEEQFKKLSVNEQELNRIFINIYGLQNELMPEVEDKEITVYRIFDTKEDVPESMEGSRYVLSKKDVIKNFISYAVGCMFGRYSLNVEGLVYAGGEWDESKYSTFAADTDNIIPICDDEYFEDDIVGRFVKFVEVVYGSESLEDNLRFIADALGGSGQSRDVIRKYFLTDFYKDHCKMYQKRPIYWLFDSGKKNGFKCLIYMHRYQPDTIARIRTDYVHEQQGRYRTAIEDLQGRMNTVEQASEKVKMKKALQKLEEKDTELRSYEEKIHHLADQMISIDLDDGVKHNYEIFKDVLAKIK